MATVKPNYKILIFTALLVLLVPVACSSTYLRRFVSLRGPDVEDYRKLPTRPVENAVNPSPMPLALNRDWMRAAPFKYEGTLIDQSDKLDALLSGNHTTAFIVLSDGKIVDERYYKANRRDSKFKCFSISKSLLSAMFGIAQSDGAINSSDRLDKHVANINNPKLGAVTLQQVLDNVSGFKYERGFAPWKQQPRMYYTADVRHYINTAEFAHEPGTKFEGEDLSPLFVGVALEAALRKKEPGITLSEFASRRIWQPMGAEYPAEWVLDRKGDGIEKVESGFVARAVDFARLGQLYLDSGRANGQQIVPEAWVRASINAPGKGLPNHFTEGFYQNLWWGYFRRGRSQDDFYANGHFGQRIYVSPDKKLVIVRMGSDTGDVNWTELIASIADSWQAAEK
jgi:CubicO group peptidase (beta-lactamase class C family)